MKKATACLLALTLCIAFAACVGSNAAYGNSGATLKQTTINNPAPGTAVIPDAMVKPHAVVTPGALGTKTGEDTIKKQIQLILDNMELWQRTGETEMYGYAVTDLDGNGRLEILSSSFGGTGFYTDTDIYEVNESLDGITLCEQKKQEGDSQADVMVTSVPVYYDAMNSTYYFVFHDLTKNGAQEYYENDRALSLQNGRVQETFLRYKTTLYTNSVQSVTYTNAEGNPISLEEYNGIADRVFAGMEKRQANLQWITNGQVHLQSMDASQMYPLLEASYWTFSGTPS